MRHSSRSVGIFGLIVLGAALGTSGACSPDVAPVGFLPNKKLGGPVVKFDLGHRPLPEIPIPNDVATFADPTSRTGRRVNASLIAPTNIERNARRTFSKLEGWGTYAPISIPFDKPLDAEDIKKRHVGDDYDFRNDVVYVINLKTGVPVPLDLGAGNFPATLRETARYWPNDPGKGESNLMFETREEDLNGNGILDPGEDTDFDGVLDHPNFPGKLRPANGVDGLYTFYESETNTLILRPMLPMDEMTEYAVVVTDRLRGTDAKGLPVESPFDGIHHPQTKQAFDRLTTVLNGKETYYGYADGLLKHAQFVFTFTTQPTVTDMFAMRDGVYEKGKLAWIGKEFPPQIRMQKSVGIVDPLDADPAGWDVTNEACKQQGGNTRFIAKYTPKMKETVESVVEQVFGGAVRGPSADRLIQGFDNIAYIAIGTIKVPWLLGDVKDVSPDTLIDYDPITGNIPHSGDEMPFFIIVPKETATHKQPFPVAFQGHGYTGSGTEGLVYGGELARHGIATIGLNAPGHGAFLSDGEANLARGLFRGGCLLPFGQNFSKTRIRDLNGDGIRDESGKDYWTAYLFHTRDMVRQATVEQVLITRALRMFDGKTKYDWDGSGVAKLAGDFDGNGVPDFGGPGVSYFAWGGSLGGILSSLAGAVDPYIVATAPVAGGGALTDVGKRSFQGGVVEAVDLRVFGPLVISVPAEARIDNKKAPTLCKKGQRSIRWVVVNLNNDEEYEIGCTDESKVAEGYDVVVENVTAKETRCAQVTKNKSDAEGHADFRLGIPASIGDRVRISFYKPAAGQVTALESYGKSCKPLAGASLAHTIDTFEGYGTTCQNSHARSANPDEAGATSGTCVRYQTTEYPIGSPLRSIAEGYGIRRQSPEFRRLLQLAQIALDPADPVTFMPYYYLKQKLDADGKMVRPASTLTINTIGDMNVPVDTGIAAARIHGSIPFLKPDNPAAKDYPDYVAPQALLDLFGGKTPNQFLIDNHVIEGIARLGRHPAGPVCTPNVVTGVKGCDDKPTYDDPKVCVNALFDADDLSDGAYTYGQQRAPNPTRLARLAKPTPPGGETAAWEPRLAMGKAGWSASEPVGGVLNAYIVPSGVHFFDPPNPCKKWDDGMYLLNILAHFFKTDGKDLTYLSNPKTHGCAAITDPNAAGACKWP